VAYGLSGLDETVTPNDLLNKNAIFGYSSTNLGVSKGNVGGSFTIKNERTLALSSCLFLFITGRHPKNDDYLKVAPVPTKHLTNNTLHSRAQMHTHSITTHACSKGRPQVFHRSSGRGRWS
jgi:hypothetical protein